MFIVYEVKLPNGKYYVGRTSIGWDGSKDIDKMVLEARDRRFGRHHRQEVKAEWIKNKKNVDILWKGVSQTGPGTPEYRKAYAACRGQEHLHEGYWKSRQLSANKSQPISQRKLNTPFGQQYLTEGRNAGLQFCRARF